MNTRTLAWGLLALWAALTVTGAVLALSQGDLFDGLIWMGMTVIASVGALLALRRPGNSIGWMLLVAAVLIALSGALAGYASSSEDTSSLTGGALVVWVDSWIFFIWLGLLAFGVPVLFPDGRPPNRRWRAFLWVGAALGGVAITGTALGTPVMEWDADDQLANPFAIPGALGDALEGAATIGEVLFALAVLVGAGGLVARLRRARGVERQQLKWFALAGSMMLAGLAPAGAGETLGAPAIVGNVGWSLFLLGLIGGLPVSIAIAVLRYRLYDIDLVIRRTLVYGALTATLLGSYLAGVLLLQLALSPLTEDNGLAIAGSTLAAAALFRPARARIQELVDRRFYRRKYDAARTVERFGARLRDQVELEALSTDLRSVVADTVQPAHISIWLKEAHR
jgi:hypothetical protein